MGINSNTYNTFVDDIAAHRVAIQIERNLMGIKPKPKRRRKKKNSSFAGETPINEIVNKEEVKNQNKYDSKISSLQQELEKLKTQNTRAVESSHRNMGSFWQRNKKDIMDAVIVLGILYIGYKLFFDKKEVSQNEMGGEVPSADTGGEIEV